MRENSYENCTKMGEMALRYAVMMYFKQHPNIDEQEIVDSVGKDGVLLMRSFLTGSLLLYHQALRQSIAQKGIDIGDFPDPISIDFESLPSVLPVDPQQ